MAADYTALHKRISKQDLGIDIPENDAVVAVDSTGIKVTNRGDWMREKHGTPRREWLKVHVAVDVESNRLLPLEVTEENTLDNEVLRPLLEDVNFEDALADGAYVTNDAFEFMKSNGEDCPGIKIRGNAVVGKKESVRSMAVLEYQKWDTKVGGKCISMGDGGQLKESSHRSSVSLVRLLGQLHPRRWFQRLKEHLFCRVYLSAYRQLY